MSTRSVYVHSDFSPLILPSGQDSFVDFGDLNSKTQISLEYGTKTIPTTAGALARSLKQELDRAFAILLGLGTRIQFSSRLRLQFASDGVENFDAQDDDVPVADIGFKRDVGVQLRSGVRTANKNPDPMGLEAFNRDYWSSELLRLVHRVLTENDSIAWIHPAFIEAARAALTSRFQESVIRCVSLIIPVPTFEYVGEIIRGVERKLDEIKLVGGLDFYSALSELQGLSGSDFAFNLQVVFVCTVPSWNVRCVFAAFELPEPKSGYELLRRDGERVFVKYPPWVLGQSMGR